MSEQKKITTTNPTKQIHMPQTELAQEIITKSQQQVAALIGRQWPDISRVMDKDKGEIKLSFTTNITDRKAKPGEQADKDNRIKTTLSFSEKFSDSEESTLEDGQPELPLGTRQETPL